jgi:trk system potassium uptake protein TrkA
MKFTVIGLGSFGANVAKILYEKNHEVVAIDDDKVKITGIKDFVTHAICMNAADKENLRAVGITDMDVVIVSLAPGMESSILTVLYLKELGVKHILVKALTEDHSKILEAIGATEIVYPERDMAIKTALRLSNPNILEYLPLMSGFGIQEIAPPASFIGKSLKELDLRNKYGITVMAIKELIPERTTLGPHAGFVIKDSDILVIIGEESQLAKLNSQ